MVDSSVIKTYRLTGDVRYYNYPSTVGELCLLGDATLLKAVIFNPNPLHIEKNFKKEITAPIYAARTFLDLYFNTERREKTSSVLKLTARTSKKQPGLFIKYEGAEFLLDLSCYTSKETDVYLKLIQVPRGSLISYGDLAARAGVPGAARFVGSTMAKNRFPIIIPCHRVIKSDGSLGNYSSGPHRKKILLDLENAL